MTELTLDAANRIVDAALRLGRETGCAPLTVAVLDPGGHLVAFQREDRSGILRPDVAIGKAWGALGMGTSSGALAERLAGNAPFLNALAAMSQGRVVPAAGGVLIRRADGGVIGAVGISGDRSDKDEACAIAGIRAAGLGCDAAQP
ncbi:MAG: heme-binding protein [Proteobacteria bacterium]|nr:heme-binding protein [Pseudomonadota bacterium]MDA1057208.1 heme-binding protein [Pseudomonadota bacterium]